jgi:hypothetical protein
LSADPTFDPSEWITLGEAAEILRHELDSGDGSSRLRLVRLLRNRPSMACIVTATLPALAGSVPRAGLTPFPDRCQWVSVDDVDWSISLVRAYPLLSGTHWESWYPPDQMLGVRVRRSEVVRVVREERAADERSLARRGEVTASLFGEPFWPVARVLAWIAFRHEAAMNASLSPATWILTKATWHLRDTNREATLLRALQDGNLPALKDGTELPREAWAGANGRDWPAVHFRREDVLGLWAKLPPAKRAHTPSRSPAANATATELVSRTPAFEPTEVAPIRNRPGKGGVKMEAAIAAMRKAVEQGKISMLELRQIKQKSLAELYPDAKRTLLAAARRKALVQIADEEAHRQNSDKTATNDK